MKGTIRKMMNDENLQFWIKESNLLKFFSFDIRPYLKVHFFHKNDTICIEGDTLNDLFFLVKGKAKLFITHTNGKVSLIDFLSAPTIIGEMELIGAQERSNGVTALTDCICIGISLDTLRLKLERDVKFLHYLCLFLSKKALKNTNKFSQNINYTLKERLSYFILLSADDNFYKEKHKEVAEYLGVSYRHLLYVLAQLCYENILEKTSDGYLIINYDELIYLSKDIKNEQENLDFITIL